MTAAPASPEGAAHTWSSATYAPLPTPFALSNSYARDGEALARRLADDGYLFIRECLDPQQVKAVRTDVTSALHAIGWLQNPVDARPVPGFSTYIGDSQYWAGLEAFLRIPSLHELTRNDRLMTLLGTIFGEPVIRQPRIVPRAVFPWPANEWSETAAHQDLPYTQGTMDALTVWMPLGACPTAAGALEVLAGSHREGLREMFGGGRYRCAATQVDEASPQWRGSDFQAGDIVIFTSLTVHRARPNTTSDVRLSMDLRYQPSSSQLCEAVLEPPFYPHVSDWPDLLDPAELSLIRPPADTEFVPFVEPRKYVPRPAGRAFPWLKS